MSSISLLKCCKPFEGEKCSKSLKPISSIVARDVSQLKGISEDNLIKFYKICTTCYVKLKKTIKVEEVHMQSPKPSTSRQISTTPNSAEQLPSDSPSTHSAMSSSDSAEEVATKKRMLNVVNLELLSQNRSPVFLSRSNKRIEREKIKEVVTGIDDSLLGSEITPLSEMAIIREKCRLYDEMLAQLKSSFQNLTEYEDKIQLLTVLPKSLSYRKISEEFNCSYHMVKVSKKLLETDGALSKPGRKTGRPLSEDVTALVRKFYEDDEISRIMPGKNDCISIRVDGVKQHIQKRLMMSTMKESYQEFKNRNSPNIKLGFSKFSLLKPKYCVQLGSSGTHSVCVCTIHQNIKLIMANAAIPSITNGEFADYKDVISFILCENPDTKCYLLKCTNCPGIKKLKDKLMDCFNNDEIYENAEIKFNQWISTDRCQLETLTKTTEDFIAYFLEKLKALIPHNFLSQQQSSFIKDLKNNLAVNEFLVSLDFAENYSFIIQNAAQGFHWNNSQATIHPFVIYYRNVNGQLEHYSFVIISDCLIHDSVAVNLFIDKLVDFLKGKFEVISKIYYLSDGAASQYKNKKNFATVLHHLNDYGIECEWHFHVTSHGKGPCDGIGGTLKRKAARASLSKEYEKVITTAKELYDWAVKSLEMNFCYVSMANYTEKENQLKDRYAGLKTIKGTRQYHAFIPISISKLRTKYFSNSDDYIDVLV